MTNMNKIYTVHMHVEDMNVSLFISVWNFLLTKQDISKTLEKERFVS